MKKRLRNLMGGLLGLLAIGVFQNAHATHLQGSEMTYTCLSPGVYSVQLKLYRDCSGASAPTTASLSIQAPGCNSGRSVNMTKQGNTTVGNPYCPQIQAPCTAATVYPNYEETIFNATVTFNATEQQCADWVFSWTNCCRPSAANLMGQSDLYAEAKVKLSDSGTPIYNNSPVFGSLVVPYVNAYMPITLSAYALDVDNDSLVYSFSAPLANATTPIAYQNYQSLTITDPDTNSAKIAMAPAGTYSPTFPMHSFDVDWTQPFPVATPYFDLNAQSGSLSFTPTAYFPNTPSVQGLNKYVTVVTVDEYRRINGQPVKIGSVRRDMFITVMDCGPNNNPRVANAVANNQPITPNTLITLRPGSPLTLTVDADDNNSNDVLEMTSDASQIMPGAVFTVAPGNRPTGTLVWTPAASDVRDQIYYFRVTVKDNACPVRGVQVQTYAVRVSHTGGVTGTKEIFAAANAFTAFPNPFSDKLAFKFNLQTKAEKLLIYNVLGQEVDQISLLHLARGEQRIEWQRASKYAAGQYVARLVSADKAVQTLKFTKLQ